MAATKQHVHNQFMAGWPIAALADKYPYTPNPKLWIENAIRDCAMRKRKKEKKNG